MAKRDPSRNPLFSRRYRKDLRRREAEERNKAWSGLTHTQQLAALDLRFGEGKGATKQRARIAKAIEDAKKPKPSAKSPDKKPGKQRPSAKKSARK